METVEIEYLGVKLTVTGSYYKGNKGSYEEQPEAREFDIHSVQAEGDIRDLISDTNAIENLILESL